jgi:polyisoprenoid-binding protein YceI
MKKLSIVLLFVITVFTMFGFKAGENTKIQTHSGRVNFYSETKLEKINSDNNAVISVLDTKTGDVTFEVLINSFEFKKAEMKTQFNEKVMETAKYPKCTFKGKITNLNGVDFTKDGIYLCKVEGNINLHGQTKPLVTSGYVMISRGIVTIKSDFSVKLSDFKIKVPATVFDKVAETIFVGVDIPYGKQ